MDGVEERRTASESRCSNVTGSRSLLRSKQSDTITSRLQSRNDLGYIKGESVSGSGLRSLSALYRSKFKKYPTFPSIYETKYQHDFKHTPFPQSPAYRPTPVKSDYSRFKFGSSMYKEQFSSSNQLASNFNVKPTYIRATPRHNPQPNVLIVSKNPNEVWGITGRSCTANQQQGLRQMKLNNDKYHRWNSR